MKRTAAGQSDGQGPPEKKGNHRETVNGGLTDVSAPAAVAARVLMATVPALAVPPPRTAWGLDRLVLDNRLAEAELRSQLQSGGSDLWAVSGQHPLPQAPILSVPGCSQGLGLSVGLVVGQQHLAATFDHPGFPLFDHRTFVLCSVGSLATGTSAEASSLAGHLRLNGLVVIACDDGQLAGEDVVRRYKAYKWTVSHAENGLAAALEATTQSAGPTLIILGSNTEAWAEGKGSPGPESCKDWVHRGTAAAGHWEGLLAKYHEQHPKEHAELIRRFSGQLPQNWRECLPVYELNERAQATRQYSGKTLGCLVNAVPEMIGGSADLTGSNLTNQGHLHDFQPGKVKNRYIRFGVRESAMISLCTGLSAYGGFIPFAATFLNFITYGWGALRLACAASAHIILLGTHDSIELGEDGPTHQPIEALAACRALPNMMTLRPADGMETVGAYEVAMTRHRPSVLALCRSGAHHLEGSSAAKVAKGGYVLTDFDPSLTPLVVLAASGTEVETCREVKTALQAIGVGVRLVSMPCWELFEEQDEEYRRSVLEPHGRAHSLRVYVEAASTIGFGRYAELHIGMTTFGASGNLKDVRKYFGFERHSIEKKTMEALRERGIVESYRCGRFGFCRLAPAHRPSDD